MAKLILNKMTGTFLVKQRHERFFPLECHIVLRKESLLPISFSIQPSNKMEGVVDVLPRPTVKKQLIPVRDSYVTEEVPTFNYGKQSQMFVGVDDKGNRLRSFLYFDLTELDKNLEIISAKLKLRVASPFYSIDMFELSTLNRKFDEYGITYANQPVREQFLNIVEIPRGLQQIEIDVTDTVLKWYEDSRINNGFVIKEFEDISGKFISFYTKESGLPPVLEIEYFDPTFGIPKRSLLDIEFNVKQHYSDSIPIEFDVWTRYGYDEIPIDLFVKAINGTLYIEGFVSQTAIPIEAHIVHKLDDSIPVEFRVGKELIDDLELEMVVSVPRIDIDMHVIKKLSDSMPIELTVTRTNLPIELHVTKPTIPIEAQIRSFSEIGIEFSVSTTTIPIEFEVIKANYLPILGSIYVKDEAFLPINFIVTREQISIEFRIVHANYLPIEFAIRQYKEIPIDVTVARKLDDNVPIDLDVRAISDLPIELDVKSRFLAIEGAISKKIQTFRPIVLDVRGTRDLPIEVEIRLKRDIPIHLEVKKVWFDDLLITFYVDSDVRRRKRGYVFII